LEVFFTRILLQHKKPVNTVGIAMNKTKMGLIAVSILLITTSLIAIYLYFNYNTLTTEYNITVAERDELTSQVNELSNKIEEYETPKLRANLEVEDKEVYLQITGEVWNVGHEPAYYCKLHVILYEGDNIAKETYVHIGDNVGMIAEQRYDRVDAKVYYEGAHVTYWEITPVVGVV
jgi:hypothetical protein